MSNGKPVFGTFAGFPKKLDIRGVEAPFGLPLPRLLTNFRIKSSLTFLFNISSYIGTVDFFDQKIFGYAEVTIWDKETNRKLSYRILMGPRRRFIPHIIETGYCVSFSKKRYIRISWDHSRDRLSLIFNLAGDSARPSVTGAFMAHYSTAGQGEITTCIPSPTKRRCSASYIAASQIHGSLSLGSTRLSKAVTMADTDGHAVFSINRNYYNFVSEAVFVTAAGIINGKSVTFTIHTMLDEDDDMTGDTQNLLFVDKECTPLPPVLITYPFGLTNKWIIQDTENMVDLTFTPVSDNFRDMSFFVIHTKFHTIFGRFEGTLKTKDGTSIPVHNFEGIAKHQLLRL
ncbi:MAG: DUF2804 domain-containing protein [Treponema sp.]|nr:DUF2804 domain-containing protein [Treponema sp.]